MSVTRVGTWALVAVYLISFPYHPAIRSPNELVRMYLTRAIVDHGQLSLNQVLQQHGMVGDMSCTLTVEQNGVDTLYPCVAPPPAQPKAAHYYSSKAPLVSFLGVPIYWLLSRFGPVSELAQVFFSRLFVTVLPALFLLWVLRRFLLAYLSPQTADWATLVYGLGTMAYAYAEAFMSHQVTAVLSFLCFFSAWRTLRGEWGAWGWLVAGLLAGATVLGEYTGALTIVCIAAWVVVARWKQWPKLGKAVALVALGAAVPIGALMAYHQACFGHPLTSGYKFLNDAAYQGWHVGGFLGIRTPDPRAFFLSFFSPLRGLLMLSPVLALAVFGLRPLRAKEPPLFVLSLVMAAANAYFTSSFAYDSWGWTVAPRHLAPWVPFLMLPVGLGLEALKGQGKVWASVGQGLGVTSVVVSCLAAFVAYVPDDVSTSVFGLAVPLLLDGVFPMTWLPAVGLVNPWSGALLLLGAAVVVGALVVAGQREGALGRVMVGVVIAHLAVLKVCTNRPEHDTAARKFLKGAWLVKNGERFSMF